MDLAEAKIVDLGCVCVMMMAKIGWTTQFFFCFVFESRCFRIGRWRWSSMMESITYNLGEFYLPDANPGGASSDVLSASLLPLETVY